MRKIIFASGEYYHIYNRGVDKREVFLDKRDYERFLVNMREFNREDTIGSLKDLQALRARNNGLLEPGVPEKLVEIVSYCLNPNHYHFILKQTMERGIERFMHKLGMGYTNYFNKKYDRSGSLFQGPFKAIHINSNEYLLYLSAYVNRNNFIHGYSLDDKWPYASYLDYIGKRNGKMCNKETILNQFKDVEEYKEFINVNALYLKEKKEMEKYLLE
jgi:REP element-mobilizing transposase RayT